MAFPWVVLLAAGAALLRVRAGDRGGGVPLPAADDPWPAGRLRATTLPDLPEALRWGAVAALALAASAPQRTVEVRPATSGVALMLAVDVSPSMAEPLDGGVSRLDAVRGEVARFLRGRDGDAVGLVLFGGDALVRVPPVVDRRPLEAALEAVRVGELGEGTALGTALGLAADRLRAVGSPSRAAVVFTDGEDNAGALDPLTAAAAAAALGQRVHVVDASADPAARALLARVAERGGGGHHAVGDPQGMAEALEALDAMERGRFTGPAAAARIPAWRALLWVALALLVAEAGVRASRWGVIP